MTPIRKKTQLSSELRVILHVRPLAGEIRAAVVSLNITRVPITLDFLTPKRRKFDRSAKQRIVDSASELGLREAVRRARNTPGFERICPQTIRRWRVQLCGPKNKPGRKRASIGSFDSAVLDRLIYASVEDADTPQRVAVEANVAYSYENIRMAAMNAQKHEEFQSNAAIQSLKFSNKWIQKWLKHVSFSRRRVTTSDKVLPPPEKIQQDMREIQEKLDDFDLEEVISADETGINYGQMPLNHYVAEGAERGSVPASDEKARITAMRWGKAKGGMAPPFIIVKCTAKGSDLSNTRVLQNLHLLQGLTTQDGWALKLWSRELKLKEKNRFVTRQYVCPYLAHANGSLITIQQKAWMDSIRVCMWLDLQLGPHYRTKRGRVALVWDNCGPHGVEAVSEIASEWGIFMMPLPKNMTDVLQVMDLVVNAPLKSAIRRARAQALFSHFQSWKIERLRAEKDPSKTCPKFQPPKPKVSGGIKTLMDIMQTTFKTDQFLNSLEKCFVDVGLAPTNIDETSATYKPYIGHNRGSMNSYIYQWPWGIKVAPAGSFSMGEAVATLDDVEVQTRNDAMDDIDAEFDDGSESADGEYPRSIT